MTTPKINNTTTVVPQNDLFNSLKTAEKPPEQSPDFHMALETTVDLTLQIDLNCVKPSMSIPDATKDYKQALTTNIDIPMTDPEN